MKLPRLNDEQPPQMMAVAFVAMILISAIAIIYFAAVRAWDKLPPMAPWPQPSQELLREEPHPTEHHAAPR